MTVIIERPVCVITPTIGKSCIQKAVDSIANQTYGSVTHLIVMDGPNVPFDFDAPTEKYQNNMEFIRLPYNVGGNGFYGHRSYASIPHLVDHDYIMFLDEDNWYEPNHIETLVKTIEKERLDFAYSMRNIYSADEHFLIEDNCESLGKWPIFFNDKEFLVDTSSYCFKKEMIVPTCHLWHYGWGADRRFFNMIRNDFNHNSTKQHTLNYRLNGNKGSVKTDFFIEGNKKNLENYNGKLPWKLNQ